jgi:hypothetical protein
MVPGSSSGLSKFNVRNYGYWKARMVSYLEALSHDAWKVTSKPIGGAPIEIQAKGDARAKNALFETINEEIFTCVHSKKIMLMKFGLSLRRSMLGLRNFLKKISNA